MLGISAFYAALCALFFAALTVNVIRLRRKHQVGLGDGGQGPLRRAIRVHGNAAETMPMVLIVMGYYESMHGTGIVLHAAGVLLLLGRLLHALGVSSTEGVSAGRFGGMIATFIALLLPTIGILTKHFVG